MSFGETESSMSLPSREDSDTSSQSQCSTDPGLIAGTWHRPLFLTRDRWFESGSLHRRVSYGSGIQASLAALQSCLSVARALGSHLGGCLLAGLGRVVVALSIKRGGPSSRLQCSRRR